MRARLLSAAVLLGACASVPPPPPTVPPEERLAAAIEGEKPPGSPDLVRLLEGLVAGGARPGEEESLRDLHRIALPEHIPDIVRLLEPARDEPYRDLLWILCNLADNTDCHRDIVAGALLYARAALLAEIDGKPEPRLADFRFPGKGPATAAAFVQRYEALLGGRESEHQEEFPEAWLDRWERQDAKGPAPEETVATPVEAFSPTDAAVKARELSVRPPDSWREDGVELDELLPLLEVAHPGALDDLLRRWEETADIASRKEIAAWRAHRTASSDSVREAEETLARLDRGEAPGAGLARIGLLGDRARRHLERIRSERQHHLHWHATAGLAIAGDAAARREFLAFLREDRISVYDAAWDAVAFTLNGDAEALEHWRSRIDANCCLRFWANEALRRWYPTMPRGDTVKDTDGLPRRTREWWARWKDRLLWSRLANGWVPVAE